MKKALNVLIFMPSLSGGGPKRLGSDFSLCLAERHKVTIVLMEDSILYPYRGNLVILGQDSLKRFPIKGLRFLVNIVRFRKLVKEYNPDFVLTFQDPPTFINTIVRHTFLKKAYRSVASVQLAMSQGEHGMSLSERFITRVFVRILYRMADVLIACSEGVKNDLVRHYGLDPGQVAVVLNPINIQRVVEASKEEVDHPWFREDVPIITNVGRLAVQKNQIDLLQAFSIVRKERICKLVIIGEGPLLHDLMDAAERLRIRDDVLFTGFEKNPFKYVARSTLFAFSSIYEGYGLAITEALAVGCPVVSTDCVAGPREILAPDLSSHYRVTCLVQEKYGLLVPERNPVALAEGIRRLLEDGELRKRYSAAGMERARDFDIGFIADRYLNSPSSENP